MRKQVYANGLVSGLKFWLTVDLIKSAGDLVVSYKGNDLGRIERGSDCWWYCIKGEGMFCDFDTRQECVEAIVRGTLNDYPGRMNQ